VSLFHRLEREDVNINRVCYTNFIMPLE